MDHRGHRRRKAPCPKKLVQRREQIFNLCPAGTRVIHKFTRKGGSILSNIYVPRIRPLFRPHILLQVKVDESDQSIIQPYYKFRLEPRQAQQHRLIKAMPRLLPVLSPGPVSLIFSFLANQIKIPRRKHRT